MDQLRSRLRRILPRLARIPVPVRWAAAGIALVATAFLLPSRPAPPRESPGTSAAFPEEDPGPSLFESAAQSERRARLGLQARLERTLRGLHGIAGAVVQLSPAGSGTPPAASVLLDLSGSALEPLQVAAVAHHVASSCPGLKSEQVRVSDQAGRLYRMPSPGEVEELQAAAEKRDRALAVLPDGSRVSMRAKEGRISLVALIPRPDPGSGACEVVDAIRAAAALPATAEILLAWDSPAEPPPPTPSPPWSAGAWMAAWPVPFAFAWLAWRKVRTDRRRTAAAIPAGGLAPSDSDVGQAVEKAVRSVPFGFLAKATPPQFAAFLQSEHPQTLAVLLSAVEPDRAAPFLERLPANTQVEVLRRIVLLDRVPDSARSAVEKALDLSMTDSFPGGPAAAAALLERLDPESERILWEGLAARDPEASARLRPNLLFFEDLADWDDGDWQALLQQVDRPQLALALKTPAPEVAPRVFRNLAAHEADRLRREIRSLGPVTLKDVTNARAGMVSAARLLRRARVESGGSAP